MKNEFENLSDKMVLHLWEKSILAYRNLPKTMPVSDKNYLLQRRQQLKAEVLRRKLISCYPL